MLLRAEEDMAVLKHYLMTLMARASMFPETLDALKVAIKANTFGDDEDRECASKIIKALEEYNEH